MIKKFLPEKYVIATGFVIRPYGQYGEHQSSKQIDLIIYDEASPVIFKEGDFVILTPDGVRAVIEVKANLLGQNVTEVIKRANENGQFIFQGKQNKDDLFFNGIFSYNGGAVDHGRFAALVTAASLDFAGDPDFPSYKVNHNALKEDYFLKYWPDEAQPHSLYLVIELAFSFFYFQLDVGAG